MHIWLYTLKVYFCFQSREHWIIYVTSSAACFTQTQLILRIPRIYLIPQSQGGIAVIKTPSRVPVGLPPFPAILCQVATFTVVLTYIFYYCFSISCKLFIIAKKGFTIRILRISPFSKWNLLQWGTALPCQVPFLLMDSHFFLECVDPFLIEVSIKATLVVKCSKSHLDIVCTTCSIASKWCIMLHSVPNRISFIHYFQHVSYVLCVKISPGYHLEFVAQGH